jgi:hypothetical protein
MQIAAHQGSLEILMILMNNGHVSKKLKIEEPTEEN